jgi:hypothetical protein
MKTIDDFPRGKAPLPARRRPDLVILPHEVRTDAQVRAARRAALPKLVAEMARAVLTAALGPRPRT